MSDQDPLFVALTRPATIFGVPMEGVLFNMMFTSIVFMATTNLFMLILCIPIHGLCWLVTIDEPRSFALVAQYMTTANMRNKHFWKGSSYSALETVTDYEKQKNKTRDSASKRNSK
ncbi:MAG: hypothetical protein HN790_05495 [Methylococcales bacterium]|jgi:type IV secretion system protein VirB3|nr:hypothetical protein [Methylococcales bacterium]